MMQRPIERASFVPIYVQLQRHLREMVIEHEDSDEPFYSDNELADIFGVNRLTIRRAIQELVDEGLLYRVRGVGTFVHSPKIAGEPVYQRGFVSQWQMQGKEVEAELLELQLRPAPARVTKALDLAKDELILFVKRLRSADKIPVVLDDIYLFASMIDMVTVEDFRTQTISSLLRHKLDQWAKTAAIDIEATTARHLEAKHLGVKTGDPLLLRKITLISGNGKPLSYGESFHRSDLFKYSLRIPVSEDRS
jgi:GntR family transcriptional regulator